MIFTFSAVFYFSGEGNIATFAKAAGARVVVNEIDANRSSLLRALKFDKISNEDAKHIHAVGLGSGRFR